METPGTAPQGTHVPARPYLTIAEAAGYIGVGTETIRRRIADGTLTSYRMKGTRAVRLRVEDVDGLLVPTDVYG